MGLYRLILWLGPTPSAGSGQAFAAKGAAKMAHAVWRFRLAALWRDGRGARHHMGRGGRRYISRSGALLVSSLMVQSISL